MKKNIDIGRLAPSPTGQLHLGNAWSFLLVWLDIRAKGGHLILRMEDLDPKRSRNEHAELIRKDLRWLGLDWDEEVQPQSGRRAIYDKALEMLDRKGLLYPCFCTRKELREIAGAPQIGDSGAPYPGLCRQLSHEQRLAKQAEGKAYARRLACPLDEAWLVDDRICGQQKFSLRDCGGDFALQRSDGVFSYQLAVVLDDIEQKVSSVVRGDDLLVSTPRQLYLYQCFGAKPPKYAHLALVLDHSGQRLAKRHHSLSLASLREAGIAPEIIIGYLAFQSGLRKKWEARPPRGLIRDLNWAPLKNSIIIPVNLLDLLLNY